jgi:hypothetical protein
MAEAKSPEDSTTAETLEMLLERVEGIARPASPLWPDSVSSLAGTWVDFPAEENLRSEQAQDSSREPL